MITFEHLQLESFFSLLLLLYAVTVLLLYYTADT